LKDALTDAEQEITARKVLGQARAEVEKIARKKIRLLNILRTDKR
jgi:hypothetical protein